MAARKVGKGALERKGCLQRTGRMSESLICSWLDVVSYLDLGLHSLMVVDTEVWVDRIVSPAWSFSLPTVSNAVLFCGVSL